MPRTVSMLGLLFALTAACASSTASSGGAAMKSQSSNSAASADKPATAQDDNKLICQTERPVGSNIPKRVCRTQAQIDKERAEAQEQMLEATRPGPRRN